MRLASSMSMTQVMPPTTRVCGWGFLPPKMAIICAPSLETCKGIEVMGHDDEICLGRQLEGRIAPVGIGKGSEPAGLDELFQPLLYGLVVGLGAVVGVVAVRSWQAPRPFSGRLTGPDDIHPVEPMQMIEVHDVVGHVLGCIDEVSHEPRIGRRP